MCYHTLSRHTCGCTVRGIGRCLEAKRADLTMCGKLDPRKYAHHEHVEACLCGSLESVGHEYITPAACVSCRALSKVESRELKPSNLVTASLKHSKNKSIGKKQQMKALLELAASERASEAGKNGLGMQVQDSRRNTPLSVSVPTHQNPWLDTSLRNPDVAAALRQPQSQTIDPRTVFTGTSAKPLGPALAVEDFASPMLNRTLPFPDTSIAPLVIDPHATAFHEPIVQPGLQNPPGRLPNFWLLTQALDEISAANVEQAAWPAAHEPSVEQQIEDLGNAIDYEQSIDMMPDAHLIQQWNREFDHLPQTYVSEQAFSDKGLLNMYFNEVYEIRPKAGGELAPRGVPLAAPPVVSEEFVHT